MPCIEMIDPATGQSTCVQGGTWTVTVRDGGPSPIDDPTTFAFVRNSRFGGFGGSGGSGGFGGGGRGGPQKPVAQPPPTPTPSKGDPNNKCDSSVYGSEINREMTGIAKKVGGHLDKDKFGNILGTISGLENVQTQYVAKRFQSAGFIEFYSYNSQHPGINLERPESNDTVWYHVTLEPGKTPSMAVPPARITIHCDNAENHTLHHVIQDYLRWGWPF
jgi:hypothetical protein